MEKVTVLLLFLSALSLLADSTILSDVEAIEAEIGNDEGSENLSGTGEVTEYLERYYEENCKNLVGEKYDEYFMPNATFNIQGKKIRGQLELQMKYGGVECKNLNYTVWDVERRDSHAIASVKYEAESNKGPILGILIHELVKDEATQKWKTDLMLDFLDVNLSRDGNSDYSSDETEIYQFVKDSYNHVCRTDGQVGYGSEETPDDLILNLGGKRLLPGLAGLEQAEINLETRCDLEDVKVIHVEVDGDTAIAMVTGHVDVDKKRHPLLNALELRKVSDNGWTVDVDILFLHVSAL